MTSSNRSNSGAMKIAGAVAGAVSALSLMMAGGAQAANLIANGNFESGHTGFSSDYAYAPAAYSNNGDIFLLTDYNGFKDHTTGAGTFLLGDGASVANSNVWSETVSTTVGTNYTFSFYHTEFNGGPNANLAVFLDGTQIGDSVAPTNGVWNQYSVAFNAGAGGAHTLAIQDLSLGYAYNDFGLDDISLAGPTAGGVPEPATWAMMLFGFAVAGAGLRRGRQAASLAA
jgi:hypothetical protein